MRSPPLFRCGLAAPVAFLLTLGLAGCSLVTIESPDLPLSEREMNTRLSTHRFIEHFIEAVTDSADRIAEAARSAGDERVLLESIRWKVGATTAITSAGFRTSPRDAIVDTWAYCAQMTGFFRDGAGESWFGSEHAAVVEQSRELERLIAGLAQRFALAKEAARWQEFVHDYAARTPLPDMLTPRRSAVNDFYAFAGIDELEAVETVGSLGQVLDDFSSQMSLMGEQLPREVTWRSQLFLHEQGLAGGSLDAELEEIGARLERLAAIADATPGLVESSVSRLEEEVAGFIAALGSERLAVMEALALERSAAMTALSRERESIVEAISRERVATMVDLQTYGDELVESFFEEVNGLAALVMGGLIVLAVVVLGVPFGIGVWVGRLSKRSA